MTLEVDIQKSERNWRATVSAKLADIVAALPSLLLTTRGDLITRDASEPVRLALGASGKILGSNGTDPQWVNQNLLQMVSTETGAATTGTTIIPFDDTIPQSNEGDQYMSLAITPKSSTSKLVIDVVCNLANNTVGTVNMAALFQDSTANALAAQAFTAANANYVTPIKFSHVMTSGTTSSTTFKVRGGANVSGTTTFNGNASSRLFGGVMASSIVIREYA